MNVVARKESKIMARLQLAALLTVGVATAACTPVHHNVAPPNMGLTPVNQPVVQRTDFVFDVTGGAGGVSPAELGRLDAWFQSLQLGYGDRVSIDAPYGDDASRRDIARVVGSYGMLLSEGAPVTAGAVSPGSVRVIVSRSTASMPSCPNWDRGRYNMTAETGSNYGCAVNGNLAAMVADPEDLVRGQTAPGAADAASVSKAVKLYREMAPTGNTLKSESTGGR